jgi:SAM-dependent methyltransferase
MNPKDIVREGYDRISHAYRSDSGDEARADYTAWLDEIRQRVPAGAAVLDLGCGCGVPAAQLLAADYAVTGVDISPVQIARARQLVPRARFLCADMTALDFPPGGIAAVVSLYAIIHVPLEAAGPAPRNPRLASTAWVSPGDRGRRRLDGDRTGLARRGRRHDVLEPHRPGDLRALAP